jgi:hypothetical protein
MPITLEKLHRLKETKTGHVSIESVPETYIHQEIQSLGKRTFALDELKRWEFMDGYGNFNCEVTVEEITSHIMSLREQFQKEHSASFFNEQRDILQQTVINKFGVGGIIARNGFDTFQNIPQGVKDTFALGGDKLGGNVTTIHNTNQVGPDGKPIYARKQDQYYRFQYMRTKNSDGKNFNEVRDELKDSLKDENGKIQDSYTGKMLSDDKDAEPQEKINIDHKYAAETYHKNGGFMQSNKKKADFATDKDNLTPTSESINKSLGPSNKKEWMDKKATDEDCTNKEKFEVIPENMEKAQMEGEEVAREHAPNSGEKAWFYGSNAALTGIGEGSKMGFRQMVAFFIREVINAVFDEIKDCCTRIKKLGEKWYHGLGDRLKRIGMKIAAKWKSILEAGKDGFVSGFCSNIVTVIINIFVTTAKNIVRLIREGFFSLVKAIKMLLKPPPEMTKQQVFHEAGKIIITGDIITFGILAEEAIDKFPPMAIIKKIPVVGELLTDVILGLLIAIVTSLALWGWDKLDIFGAKREMQHKFVMENLEKECRAGDDEYRKWLESVKEHDASRYEYLRLELGLV